MGAPNTRDQILNAAVEIMAQKGKDASIADIATAAGVTVSNIYHYFKNKEDLLFHTAGAYIGERIPQFKMRLQGIREPVSLLTKFIWEQLRYHDENQNYAKFTLFECRSRKNFFQHEAFTHFSNWSQTMKDILTEGRQKGVFSSDISTTITRDMIQGLLDIESILYFVGKQAENPLDDFDDILDILLPFLSTEPENDASMNGNKRDIIIETAEKLFADKGYGKSTTIEIAKMAGLAERTLYEYFENKEDILFSVLQHRLNGHRQALADQFIITHPMQKLKRTVYYYFTIYLRQPSFIKTFILDGIFNPHFYVSKSYDELAQLIAFIDRILEEGKAHGCIGPLLNNRIFINLFLGIFSQTMLRWHFSDQGSMSIDMARWIEKVASHLIRIVSLGGRIDRLPETPLA